MYYSQRVTLSYTHSSEPSGSAMRNGSSDKDFPSQTESWQKLGSGWEAVLCAVPHTSLPITLPALLDDWRTLNFAWLIYNSGQALLQREPHMHLNAEKGPFWTKRPLQTGFWTVLCTALLLKREHVYQYCTKQVSPGAAVACGKQLHAGKAKQVYMETTKSKQREPEGIWGNLQHKPVNPLKYLSDESAWFQMSCIY